MLFEVNTLQNKMLPFSVNSSDLKETGKTNIERETNEALDFQSILESINEEKNVAKTDIQKTDEYSSDIEADEELDTNEGIIEKISYLVNLLLEVKSNYEEADDIKIKDVLVKLEESLKEVEYILNSNEPLYLNINTEEMEALIDIVGQVKGIAKYIAKDIVSAENFEDFPLIMEIENAVEQIEKSFVENLDTIEATIGDIDKEKASLIKEDVNFEENNNLQLDHSFENEDIAMEGIKTTEDAEMTENNMDFADDNLMEDGEAETTMDSNYTFNIFNKDMITNDNSIDRPIDVNFIQDYDTEDLIQQIVEKIEIKESFDKQEVKIRLKPDYLGDLVVKMEVVDGSIQAKIVVDNYRTKEIIESNLFQLKEQFEENSLEIKTFEVFVGTNEDFERERRNEHFFRKSPQKLKLGTKVEDEIRIYDSNLMKQREEIYHEGKLNLFV